VRVSCKSETMQGVPIPFKIVEPSDRPAYLYQTGPLDDMLRTYRSVVGALEIAADVLVEAYGLMPGAALTATVRPLASAMQVTVESTYAGEDEE